MSDSEIRERPRVTLAEVAARCGVSRMTVSNAYNRPDQLSAELRQRVLATAEELGYGGPSAAGRALKRGRNDVLGVLLTEALPYAFGDPGTVSFLHGVTAATAAAGLALQLIPAAAETAERLVRDSAVDGLIAHSPADGDPALAAALRRRLPTVVSGGPGDAGADCVTIDNEAAAAGAARHLIGLGHRTLGVVTWRLHPGGYAGWADQARQDSARYEVFRLRLLGYRRAAAQAGCHRPPCGSGNSPATASPMDAPRDTPCSACPARSARPRCSPAPTCWPSECCRRPATGAWASPATCR